MIDDSYNLENDSKNRIPIGKHLTSKFCGESSTSDAVLADSHLVAAAIFANAKVLSSSVHDFGAKCGVTARIVFKSTSWRHTSTLRFHTGNGVTERYSI